ncbi:MAG: rhodanese-like domain-containing protein [Gemmatimonadetes bacterium]|nr:rhodanese-like domain-containing protein [Gemmatimonadota bacterium]
MTGFRQGLILVVVATAVGFAANVAREKPLPLRGSLDPPAPPEPGADLPAASADEALAAWENGAFFLDVREPGAFDTRRVAGSYSVPPADFDDRYFEVVSDFGPELPLVVYGAAADSFVVRRTAARLMDLGHSDVLAVTSGLESLLAAGLAPDSGDSQETP